MLTLLTYSIISHFISVVKLNCYTTKTIDGAQISDMAKQQGFAANNPWLPTAIICLAAAGLVVAVWVFLRQKKRIGHIG
jgi:hypothetical protein